MDAVHFGSSCSEQKFDIVKICELTAGAKRRFPIRCTKINIIIKYKYMFSTIEKEYNQDLVDHKFNYFYWPKAIIIVIISLGLTHIFQPLYWSILIVMAAILLGLIIYFLNTELAHASRENNKIQECNGIVAKLQAYFEYDIINRRDNLAVSLIKYNLANRDGIKLALDYYQSRLPISTKPNFLDWILTTVITLAPIVVIAYDNEIDSINIYKMIPILISALSVAFIIVMPLVIARVVAAIKLKNRTKIDSILVEDLAYFYANFDEFRKKYL